MEHGPAAPCTRGKATVDEDGQVLAEAPPVIASLLAGAVDVGSAKAMSSAARIGRRGRRVRREVARYLAPTGWRHRRLDR